MTGVTSRCDICGRQLQPNRVPELAGQCDRGFSIQGMYDCEHLGRVRAEQERDALRARLHALARDVTMPIDRDTVVP